MLKRVLIIDNFDSFTYNLRQIVEELHYDYSIIKNNEVTFSDVEEHDKIIISPGPGLPDESGNIKEIIKVFSATKSILGVCLGHQAIAEVFGAALFNFEKVCHGLKTNAKIISDDYLFANIPSQFEVGLYHSWAVSKNNFPDCLSITAISQNDIIMAIAHKELDVKGVQFHPESIMTSCGPQIISNWLKH